MAILIIAEHNYHSLKPATLSTITAAQTLAMPIDILVIGHECESAAQQASYLEGVRQVIMVNKQELKHFLAEPLAQVIVQLAIDYTHIMAPGTTFGKNVLPCVAALLDVMQISEVLKIHSEDTFDRPMYAGNIIATLKSYDPIKVMTIRSTNFAKVNMGLNQAPIVNKEIILIPQGSAFVSAVLATSNRPELGSAKIVVSGGRALGSQENFKLIEELADCLKAAVGASRAAVDAGYVPNDHQVGQTGKIVAPELYIAIGISGAIQHIAGMKDSKIIIAINKDPEAPIFQIADFGLVEDLFEAVPALVKQLSGVSQ